MILGQGMRGRGNNQHHHNRAQRNEERKTQNEVIQGSIYNQIPEDKRVKAAEEQPKKVETVLKTEDLFGDNDILNKLDKKEVKVNYKGFEIQGFGDEDEKKK